MSRCDLTTSQLYMKQIEIEKDMVDLGAEKYLNAIADAEENGRGADTTYARDIVAQLTDPIVSALGDLSEQRSKYYEPLKILNLNRAVVITLRTMLALTTHKPKESRPQRTRVAQAVGDAIQLELKMQSLCDDSPEYMKEVQASWNRKKANSVRHKNNVVNAVITKKGLRWEHWDTRTKVSIGAVLIEAVCKYSDIFQSVTVSSKNRKTTYIEITDEALEWIEKHKDFRSALQPLYRPMLVPPVDWSPTSKPYITPAVNSTVRFVRHKRSRVGRYYKNITPNMYEAINIAQATPWKINKSVFDLLTELKKLQNPMLIPSGEMEILPEYPFPQSVKEEDLNEDELHVLRDWKTARREIYTRDVARKSNRRRLDMILDICEDYKQYDRIYFPHSVDSRGRIYSIPTLLQPQGDDVCKGILEFSEAQVLTDEGVQQLKLHIAGKYGLDKESHTKRFKWFADNESLLLAVAKNPLDHLDWLAEADKPFQTYAGLVDYARWKRNPNTPVCARVNKDGACNGLQHFSAMLRDGDVGNSVNLTKSHSAEIPASIYKVVAHEVQSMLDVAQNSAECVSEREFAGMWVQFWKQYGKDGTVDYKCMKRPVMTLPYSATMFSRIKYVKEYIKDLGDDAQLFFGKKYGKATKYFTDIITEAMSRRISSATLLLDWLTTACRDVMEHEDYVSWKTPMDFEVFNRKLKRRTKTVPVKFENRKIIYSYADELEDDPDIAGMASAIAPNFVHSMDACHMLNIVKKCAEYNIKSLHLVHDDYGTHANQGALLAQIAKEEFVRMYEDNDPIQDFYDKYSEIISTPPPEKIGTLDLSEVIESTYAFD